MQAVKRVKDDTAAANMSSRCIPQTSWHPPQQRLDFELEPLHCLLLLAMIPLNAEYCVAMILHADQQVIVCMKRADAECEARVTWPTVNEGTQSVTAMTGLRGVRPESPVCAHAAAQRLL